MSDFDPDEAYEDLLLDLKLVMQEQVETIKLASKKGKLSVADNKTLLELVRQIKQLAKEEFESALQMPDDALEKIYNRETVRRHREKKKNESFVENRGQSFEAPQTRTRTDE